jgi:hypothetical protein
VSENKDLPNTGPTVRVTDIQQGAARLRLVAVEAHSTEDCTKCPLHGTLCAGPEDRDRLIKGYQEDLDKDERFSVCSFCGHRNPIMATSPHNGQKICGPCVKVAKTTCDITALGIEAYLKSQKEATKL